MPKRGKLTKRTRNRSLIDGIRKHPEAFAQAVGPEALKGDDLVACFEEHLRVLDEIDQYDNLKSAAIVREALLERRTRELWWYVVLRARSYFKPDSVSLRDFGVKPKRKPKTTIVKKAIAVAKRKATRRERGTMGKRQRKNAKG